ncbi:uncharacterized protein [Littorina saxatilis]|uniref:Uncharacterized protein n=1 Tax=Littorina saxatilis TaxID=31220 RepID=A0AAN9BE44_9CAEN
MPVRDFRTISTWLKIALVCLSLGVLLFVIGFATESWVVVDSGHHRGYVVFGLWKTKDCRTSYACSTHKYDNRYLQDYHKATQAMECLGLIGMLLAFLLLLLYVFVDSCRRREALLATIFFLFGAVVCMVIGFIVFATHYENYSSDIGWSMGVAIAGCILTFIAGVMCVLQILAK